MVKVNQICFAGKNFQPSNVIKSRWEQWVFLLENEDDNLVYQSFKGCIGDATWIGDNKAYKTPTTDYQLVAYSAIFIVTPTTISI